MQLFAQIIRQPPQSVSQLAASLRVTMPVASQSLRALEARGLLKVKRVHRRVEYRLPTAAEAGTLAKLIAVLRGTLLGDAQPNKQVFKLATAFTHPARIEIYRLLHGGPLTPVKIKVHLRLSWPALLRHLAKLERRGYLNASEPDGRYGLTAHQHPLGRVFARLALAEAE